MLIIIQIAVRELSCLEYLATNKMGWTYMLALETRGVDGLFVAVFSMSEQGAAEAFLERGCCSPLVAGRLPECWYDQSFGDVG